MELLTKAPIFEGLAPAELEPLRTAIRTRSFAKGAYLFREGDPGSHLYMVVEGEVKIGRVGEGGGQVVFAIAGPRRGLRRAVFVRRRGRKDSRCSGPEADCLPGHRKDATTPISHRPTEIAPANHRQPEHLYKTEGRCHGRCRIPRHIRSGRIKAGGAGRCERPANT